MHTIPPVPIPKVAAGAINLYQCTPPPPQLILRPKILSIVNMALVAATINQSSVFSSLNTNSPARSINENLPKIFFEPLKVGINFKF